MLSILSRARIERSSACCVRGSSSVTPIMGSSPKKRAYTWFIDPIDGTRAFMMGSPLWGTLVGLTHNDTPLFGLLSQPVLEEIFFGATEATEPEAAAGRR